MCAHAPRLSPAQEDTLLRFSAIVKAELDRTGAGLAVVARSGLSLQRFEQRYSHAGLSLRDSPNTPWSVRQLYYACDEGRPRLFDEGLSGFVQGSEDPALGYVSAVLLPPAAAEPLAAAALDNAAALALLGADYSANAYPFSTRYQNCNQWLAELLALAWAPDMTLPGGDADTRPAAAGAPVRTAAQRWLAGQGYAPQPMRVGWLALMWLAPLIPYVHNDDHPPSDFDARAYQVSMPASIEAFLRAGVPGATRLEFCHAGPRVVVHRGWTPVAEGCVPGPDDQVLVLR